MSNSIKSRCKTLTLHPPISVWHISFLKIFTNKWIRTTTHNHTLINNLFTLINHKIKTYKIEKQTIVKLKRHHMWATVHTVGKLFRRLHRRWRCCLPSKGWNPPSNTGFVFFSTCFLFFSLSIHLSCFLNVDKVSFSKLFAWLGDNQTEQRAKKINKGFGFGWFWVGFEFACNKN